MADNVEFQDFSFQVKEALNDTSIAWLYTTSEEIKSQAQRTTSTTGWTDAERTQLRDSYAAKVNESKGEAQVGTPLEQGYWEEWGTGEHAAHGDGRKGWWIYCPDQPSMGGGNTYHDEMEAMMMAAYIQSTYGKKAYVTNGRKPNYTLENAFGKVKNPAIEKLEQLLKGRMGT
jgi:hypothetical protein